LVIFQNLVNQKELLDNQRENKTTSIWHFNHQNWTSKTSNTVY
jgi:hypothetical protein